MIVLGKPRRLGDKAAVIGGAAGQVFGEGHRIAPYIEHADIGVVVDAVEVELRSVRPGRIVDQGTGVTVAREVHGSRAGALVEGPIADKAVEDLPFFELKRELGAREDDIPRSVFDVVHSQRVSHTDRESGGRERKGFTPAVQGCLRNSHAAGDRIVVRILRGRRV